MENELIYSYTRQQAIEDGGLVDISQTSEAREAGFKIPVCLTAGVYSLVELPSELAGMQDFKGRLWDVCYMATMAFKKARAAGADLYLVPFTVRFQMTRQTSRDVKLWLCFNEAEGFTVMLPEEY